MYLITLFLIINDLYIGKSNSYKKTNKQQTPKDTTFIWQDATNGHLSFRGKREMQCLGGCPTNVPVSMAHEVPPYTRVTEEEFATSLVHGHDFDR